MYKFLLCWRYLRTRYIALVTIISVMLGVAAMIATNAVMEGAKRELQDRIHGFLSDIIFSSRMSEGEPDAERYMEKIRRIAGDSIEGMTPTVTVPGLLSFRGNGRAISKQIMLVGVDEESYSNVSDMGQFLQHSENRKHLDFMLKQSGYDEINHMTTNFAKATRRPQLPSAGWSYRRNVAALQRRMATPIGGGLDEEFAAAALGPQQVFDASKDTHTGAVLGIDVASFRGGEGTQQFIALPGDDVEISFLTGELPPAIKSAKFTVVDFYESRYVETDSQFVFVPLGKLQQLRGMIDPQTGIANFTSIQIRVKPGVDLDKVRDLLKENFPRHAFEVETWRDRQGPLIAAVQFEMGILNVLLSLIIAVAGFGILAIFFMIVVEKTRDIGILKSLGASNHGVMGIFVSYGLSLGVVGAGAGLGLGLLIANYIADIADIIGRLVGHEVFNPEVYKFHEIPAVVETFTVACVLLGAISIAVLASILPARRAARLHPVEALRYE